jgi:hypothetical protein
MTVAVRVAPSTQLPDILTILVLPSPETLVVVTPGEIITWLFPRGPGSSLNVSVNCEVVVELLVPPVTPSVLAMLNQFTCLVALWTVTVRCTGEMPVVPVNPTVRMVPSFQTPLISTTLSVPVPEIAVAVAPPAILIWFNVSTPGSVLNVNVSFSVVALSDTPSAVILCHTDVVVCVPTWTCITILRPLKISTAISVGTVWLPISAAKTGGDVLGS